MIIKWSFLMSYPTYPSTHLLENTMIHFKLKNYCNLGNVIKIVFIPLVHKATAFSQL